MTAADPPGLDLDRLRGHLDQQRPGLVTGRLRAAADRGRPVQPHLRRHRRRHSAGSCAGPRSGHVLATAHDMGREHRVISALHRHRVPVPRHGAAVRGRRGDRRAVLRHGVRGRARRTAPGDQLAALGPARTRTVALGLVDTLGRAARGGPRGASGSPTSAAPRASSTGSCAAGASSSTPPAAASCPAIDELHAALGRALPAVRPGRDRARRLPARQRARRTTTTRSPRSWTGRCPRSATRSPTSALLVMYSDAAGHRRCARSRPRPPRRASRRSHELVERYAGALRPRRLDAVCTGTRRFACFKLAVILEGIHYRFTPGPDRRRGLRPDRRPGGAASSSSGLTRLDSDPGPTEGA